MEAEKLTKEEQKQLALDIFQKKVFVDRFIKDDGDPRLIFMVLSFMDEEQFKGLLAVLGESGMIYEYYDKAGPLSMGGYPSFFSMKVLNTEQANYVLETYRELKKSTEAVLAS